MKRVERCSLDSTKLNSPFVISEHLAHYRLILPLLKGKILDAGSGEGYGVDIMRKAGLDAWGMDLSPEVVEMTSSRYGAYFKTGSITEIPYPDQTFDAVTCMEVIEHIPEEQAIIALRDVFRILKPGGTLILSTPNAKNTPPQGTNEYHLKEYTRAEILDRFQKIGFAEAEFYALICTNKAIQEIHKSRIFGAWFRFKTLIGLNRPIGGMGHIMEKVLTGHTSRNILNEDCWKLVRDDDTSMTMMLIGHKRG
jgi:ubiquinone/menaquinone biosynthesis C-methylase UbiE